MSECQKHHTTTDTVRGAKEIRWDIDICPFCRITALERELEEVKKEDQLQRGLYLDDLMKLIGKADKAEAQAVRMRAALTEISKAEYSFKLNLWSIPPNKLVSIAREALSSEGEE